MQRLGWFLLAAWALPLPCPAVSPPEPFEEPIGPVVIEFLELGGEVRGGARAGVPETAKRNWGPEQLVGPPDTPGAGDIPTAWASATQDEQDEWIEVEYAERFEVRRVLVHETFNPGAVVAVKGFTETGMEVDLWKGVDPIPRTEPRGVAELHPNVRLATRRLRIELNSREVPGWNEIDTVGLVDDKGRTHWPVRARASSTYAGGEGPAEFLLPDPE